MGQPYSQQDIIDMLVERELAAQSEVSGRAGRRLGRAFGAIATLGTSEIARRRGQHRGRQMERRAMERGAMETVDRDFAPDLSEQVAARVAAMQQQQQQLGFRPAGELAGYFGIADVTVAALGTATSQSTAQEPTQIHRIVLDAYDPTATITPQQAFSYLRVGDIRIGTQSMFNNVTPMPLGILANNTTMPGVMTRIIMPGQDVTVTYVNRHPTLALVVGGSGIGPNS